MLIVRMIQQSVERDSENVLLSNLPVKKSIQVRHWHWQSEKTNDSPQNCSDIENNLKKKPPVSLRRACEEKKDAARIINTKTELCVSKTCVR